MVQYFTWHDIEKKFEEKRTLWNEDWFRVQVYNDEVIIYGRNKDENKNAYAQNLKKIFAKNYDLNTHTILIDFTGNRLNIYYEEEEKTESRQYMPLFKEKYLQKGKDKPAQKLPCKMIAFHSYKGGVGRTLSLISFLKSFSSLYPQKKVLVIDADVEAPGLTWMFEDKSLSDIGYLDILSLMKYEKINDEMIDKLAEMTENSIISVKTDQIEVEQYFIPVYHDKNQVLNIETTSDHIIFSQKNQYIISETIAKLGERLGTDLVLIDLRAGITEFSAPFLFDSRVGKYFVSSTSMQSIRGINQIMEQVFQKTELGVENSQILLTAIPRVMEEEKILAVEDSLLKNIEAEIDVDDSTFLKSDFICRIPFDERLIHIENFDSLCETLKGSEITEKMEKIITDIFEENKRKDVLEESFVRETLKKIYDLASEEITAEGNSSANMLVTHSIKELARGFKNTVPKIVISGSKGSGKTYIYKQLLAAKTWEQFENTANQIESEKEGDTIIIPLLSSFNLRHFIPLLEDAISFANENIHEINLKKSFINTNISYLKNFSEDDNSTKQKGWNLAWEHLLLSVFDNKYHDLQAMDDYLEEIHKKVIFLVDGLEDLLMDMQNQGNPSWKLAFKAICQDLINKLSILDNGNIGLIVFARKDMVNEAIDTNTEQFLSQYKKYELNWTQTEALRLALWLSAKAYPKLAENIQITSVTKDIIIERLAMLWGNKLGKDNSHEARSNLWIIAALSDFTGQLQARDIVRFLQNATDSYASVNLSSYPDRFIMPSEIRKAIDPCSDAKLDDIKKEMKSTYSILSKFMNMDENDKKLPITLDKILLSGDEIAKLEAEGYLKIYNKKYYLPEIIRSSLKFSYKKGARPKVLSFLVQQ